MIFRIGLENNVGGRSQAWVLDHPGCYAYGIDDESALAAAPDAILDYSRWLGSHAGESIMNPEEIEIRLEETWDVYTIDEYFEPTKNGYEVNAWFRHDWKPLSAEEIERGMQLLNWTREDLLESVRGMTAAELDRSFTGERWSYAGILNHIGGAEWWYMDRLDLVFPRDQVSQEPFKRLEMVRSHLNLTLPTLDGSRQVIGIDGEFWSPRKMLRRAVWHERDHTDHIRKLQQRARTGSPQLELRT